MNIEGQISIVKGLFNEKHREAVEIYYEAFYKKIKRLLLMPKTKEQALRVMENIINFESGFFAILNNKVVGLAGIQTSENEFYQLDWRLMRKEFGFFGAVLRFIIFTIAESGKVKKNVLRIDSLAVVADMRGKGIGAKLLDHIFQYAGDNGFDHIVLEVVNTNPGAKKLYERLGFYIVKTIKYGFLTKKAGFTAVIHMMRDI